MLITVSSPTFPLPLGTPNGTNAIVKTTGNNDLPLVYDKNGNIDVIVDPGAAGRILAVTYTNGSKSGTLESVPDAGLEYRIPADVVATLDASKGVVINVQVVPTSRILTITNTAGPALTVTYLVNANDANLTSTPVAANGSLGNPTPVSINTLGTVTITSAIEFTVSGANTSTIGATAVTQDEVTGMWTWDSGTILDNLVLTVAAAS